MTRFRVVDLKKGGEPDLEQIALKEEWATGLIYCDMEGFALTEHGELVLFDECGNLCHCPDGRFQYIMVEDSAVARECAEIARKRAACIVEDGGEDEWNVGFRRACSEIASAILARFGEKEKKDA